MTVVTAGEALIDLTPRDGHLLPLPGGSPYNVAVGLARLGSRTHYLGRLSTDGFGQQLWERLANEGVDLSLVTVTPEPTTLAVVHLDDEARATYAFYLAATSASQLPQPLPVLPSGAALHVSFGALGLESSAGAALAELLRSTRGDRVRCLDPNVRPAAVTDIEDYAGAMDGLAADCDLVKVSDEDLMLLYPAEAPAEVAKRWATSGPAAVVVTRGPHGASLFTLRGDHLDVPGHDVDVVDTVGAGDAFTSGLLASLEEGDHLRDRSTLEAAVDDDGPTGLAAAVRTGVQVAAVTCTRAGSDPPRADEL